MERSILDELEVPQPPYRMARPVAVLAAVGDPDPFVPPPAPAIEVPPAPEPIPPQQPPEVFEISPDELELIEAEIEAAPQAEKDRMVAAGPLNGTPEENAQNTQNEQAAGLQMDAKAIEEAANLRRLAAVREELKATRTPEEQAQDAVIAAALKKDKELRNPPGTELRRQQEEAAAPRPLAVGDKTPLGEVISISPEGKPKVRVENPAPAPEPMPEPAPVVTPEPPKRDYSILDGLEPDRTPEQRAADNALAEELKARQARGQSPQPKEPTINDRISEASKEAQAQLNKFLNAIDSGASAAEVAAAAGASRAADENLEAAKRAERPTEDQTIRESVGAQKYADSVKRAREMADARRAEVMAAEPKIGMVVPEKGKVVGYDAVGRATYEVKTPREVNVGKLKPAEEPVFPQEVGQQNKEATPRQVREKPTPRIKQAREAAQKVLDERDQQRAAGEGMGTARQEGTPPPAASEAAPKTPEQKLQEENEQLRAELEQLRQQAGERTPAKSPEKETGERGRTPSGDFDKVAEKILAGKEKAGFFSQQWLNLKAMGENAGRFWNSVWATRSKDVLEARTKRLAELEAEAEQFVGPTGGTWKRSAKVAAAAVFYGPRINWYKSGVEQAHADLQAYEEDRKRHEENRGDMINLMIVRDQLELQSTKKRANSAEKVAAKYDAKIESYYMSHRQATEEYVSADDAADKAEKLEDVRKFERLIQSALQSRSAAKKEATQLGARAAAMEAEHNTLDRVQEIPHQPDTSYTPIRRAVARKKRRAPDEQAA